MLSSTLLTKSGISGCTSFNYEKRWHSNQKPKIVGKRKEETRVYGRLFLPLRHQVIFGLWRHGRHLLLLDQPHESILRNLTYGSLAIHVSSLSDLHGRFQHVFECSRSYGSFTAACHRLSFPSDLFLGSELWGKSHFSLHYWSHDVKISSICYLKNGE